MVPKHFALTLALFVWGGLHGQSQAATRYVQEPQREACRLWEEVEQAVWDGRIERKEAQAKFKDLWPQITIKDLPQPKDWQWIFPLPGSDASNWSSQSYHADSFRFYDGPQHKGYPAIAIFAWDHDRNSLDDRTGKPIPVVSAADGVVVSARKFWAEGEANPLGVYVCVLNLEEQRFFYYAGMSKLKVGVAQVVSKGQVLGWLGRTAARVRGRNLGTQLRFEVHTFDDALFYPVYPARALREAKHLPFPLPDPDYTKAPKKKR